jgi:hypothetical protein
MRIRQMSDFFKYSLIDVHEGSNDNADWFFFNTRTYSVCVYRQ